ACRSVRRREVIGRIATPSPLVSFFQAEDGIRDRNVTGVQTCALPICDRGRHLLGLAVADADRPVAVPDDDESGEAEATTTLDDRSEERRVGKERGSAGARHP